MLTTVRVQEKGQVTIPREIRRRLKLKKGDMVTFFDTEDGVVIKPLEKAANDLLSSLGKKLKTRGIILDSLLERSRTQGADLVLQQLGLSIDERTELFQLLQIHAMISIESIRKESEASGLDQLTEDEIDAEIQATRKDVSNAHRS